MFEIDVLEEANDVHLDVDDGDLSRGCVSFSTWDETQCLDRVFFPALLNAL